MSKENWRLTSAGSLSKFFNLSLSKFIKFKIFAKFLQVDFENLKSIS